MLKGMGRRDFLKDSFGAAAGALGFPYIVSSSAMGSSGQTAASERIAMGFVGVGSMGGGHLRTFLGKDDVRVVAACDLRKKFRERAEGFVRQRYGDNSGFETHHDYREMLGRDDIDAVCIATPEHWHALIAIEAARQGKDMYLEKPIDVHVAIAKALRDAVNRYGVVFQFGTQQRSGREFRLACELVRNERIGRVHAVVVGSVPGAQLGNQAIEPAPPKEEFDYDMWLGPAPWAPYSFQRSASRAEGSPGYWMHIHDYGLGCLSGAWGIHHVDIAQWGLDADDTGPVEVEGTGRIPEDGLCDTPVRWRVEHKYANGVKMIHADLKNSLAEFLQFDNNGANHKGCGILFLGSEGWVLVWRGGIDAHPKSLLDTTFGPNEIRLPVSNDHRGNFLDCVRTRQQPIAPIESAVRSDTVCHLDDIAIRLGRRLRWNPELEEFFNDDEANRMLSRPMRSPWHL
jgi:predicted dehydrogenase